MQESMFDEKIAREEILKAKNLIENLDFGILEGYEALREKMVAKYGVIQKELNI